MHAIVVEPHVKMHVIGLVATAIIMIGVVLGRQPSEGALPPLGADVTSCTKLDLSEALLNRIAPPNEGWLATGFQCEPRCRGRLTIQLLEGRGNYLVAAKEVMIEPAGAKLVVAFRPPTGVGDLRRTKFGEVRFSRVEGNAFEDIARTLIDFSYSDFISAKALASPPPSGWLEPRYLPRDLVDGVLEAVATWSWNGGEYDGYWKHWSHRQGGRVMSSSPLAKLSLEQWPNPLLLVVVYFLPNDGSPLIFNENRFGPFGNDD